VGTPHEVFAKPTNVFVASFIGTPQMNLMQANLTGFKSGEATMDLGGNALNLTVNPAANKLKNPKITLGIRPRAFTTVDKPMKDSLTAQAELIEPMGAETLIHARLQGGGEIRAVVPREKRVKVGETLHLKLDATQTHIFGDDGKAVRA
jgi:multiple sugar transport system ATP-binding protein